MICAFIVVLGLTGYLILTQTNLSWVLLAFIAVCLLIEVFTVWLNLRFYRQFVSKYQPKVQL